MRIKLCHLLPGLLPLLLRRPALRLRLLLLWRLVLLLLLLQEFAPSCIVILTACCW
jgi:hypothetical protein